jgi:hypothetical protein
MPTAAIVEAGQAIENAIQEYRDVVKLLACMTRRHGSDAPRWFDSNTELTPMSFAQVDTLFRLD